MINQKLVLMLPLVLLTAATSIGINQARGWDGPWGGGYNGPSDFGCGAYCAGQTDAQYDHENNIGYQPYGSCLPCHSEEYWSNFRQGYDQQWNAYQGQSTDQGSSINIYGNNNYVNTNQYSNQQQNPLQQLAKSCMWMDKL
jgi:hypothetical protein